MAEFIEKRLLDACPAYTFSGGPTFSTRVNTLANGREYRNQSWVNPRHQFSAPFLNIDQEVFESIKAAFYVAKGQAYAFRFKDWTDYRATDAPLGVSPAGSTPVQLLKQYQTQAEGYARKIVKPVASTVQVRANGTLVAGSVDDTTGLFTPSGAWAVGATLTWSGEFDVPVRFNTDQLPFTLDNPNALNGDVALLEVFL
jgi:uncharacterized protein (TIGR02217 family)